MGKCPDCGEWNTLVEEKQSVGKGRQGRPSDSAAPVPLSEVTGSVEARMPSGIGEFDRVLGGGVVAGSVVLVGGDPGIGKSTLLLQAVARLKGTTLYVSGEESPEQIKLRAERMGIRTDSVMLYPETALGSVLDVSRRMEPAALVIDSIQTVYTGELESAPGSVGQVRECASELMFYAKHCGPPGSGAYCRYGTLLRG
jgi:DNA repair protein RadA/Sms